MILRLLLPHERFFSSLFFATVAHSAPSLGTILVPNGPRHCGGGTVARDRLTSTS